MRKYLLLFLLVLLCGCSTNNPSSSSSNVCGFDCEEANMDEYSLLEGNTHVFVEADYEQSLQMLENDSFTGIIYYGYPACPWCDEAIVEMNDAAKSLDLSIYYVNKKSEENLKQVALEEKIEAILDNAYGLMKDEEEKPHLFVPEVVVIKNGKIIDHHLGTFDAHDAHERDLNEEEKQQLENIYKGMFVKIK